MLEETESCVIGNGFRRSAGDLLTLSFASVHGFGEEIQVLSKIQYKRVYVAWATVTAALRGRIASP